jgi:thiosulfate/3-mercaptopyruvate sulfurtransferase
MNYKERIKLNRRYKMKLKTLVVSMLVVFLSATTSWAISLVDAEWLKANLDDKNIRIVDVSNKPDSYGKGHIPGAVKVNRYHDLGNTSAIPPTLYPTKEQFEQLMSRLGIDKDSVVVAYDDTYSIFASRLLVLMELYGHDTNKMKLLNGGMVKWKALEFPVTKDAVRVKPAKYHVDNIRLDIFVSWSDIYRDVVLGARPEVMLLDSRPEAEYTAKNIRSIRGGHIPKAANVTGANANNKEDHTYKPIAEIKKMYEEKGFTSDKTIYEYCHSGDRSAHAYIILKHLLGYKNVRFNDGGWVEWSNILSLPAAGQVWLWEAPKEVKK